MLHDEKTKAVLSNEENLFVEQHIPYTVLFSEKYIDLKSVLENKNEYILKPIDSYASNGVYAGTEFDETKWEQIVKSVYNKIIYAKNIVLNIKPKILILHGVTEFGINI